MSYLDPIFPSSTPYSPGQEAGVDVPSSDEDSNSSDSSASWIPDFNKLLSQPGMKMVGTSAIGFDRAFTDAFKNTISGKKYLGVTLAESNIDDFRDYINQNKDELLSRDASSSAHDLSGYPVSPETVDYIYADLAKHYGMDSSTAYQEALSNTAYQRAIADMKRAGLNPASIFGAGRGQGASGVSYIGKTNSGYGYSSDEEYGLSKSQYSLLTGLGGVVAVALLKGIHNPYVRFLIGTSAAKGLAGLVGISQGK